MSFKDSELDSYTERALKNIQKMSDTTYTIDVDLRVRRLIKDELLIYSIESNKKL